MLHWRLGASKFIVVVTLANMIIYHIPLYSFVFTNIDYLSVNGIFTFLVALVALFVITSSILFLLAIVAPVIIRPFCILMALTNSIAVYFVVTYQVILGKNMMGNAFNTRSEEALDYLHPMLLVYLFFLGVIPSWLLLKVRIEKVHRLRLLSHAFMIIILGLSLAYMHSSSWLWFDKHAKTLGGMSMPWSYVGNAIRYQSDQLKKTKKQVLLPPATFANDEKVVVVLVIGETARSHNFSLYGYNRPTNPLLEKSGIITMKNTTACSTYTTASLTCILSHTDRDSDSYEPLPSYLHRNGVDVIWRTVNWGEPPIDVDDYQVRSDLKGACEGAGCDFDELLLTGLSERIQSSNKQKVFVVLHTKGSHGPSYYTRYPKQFEVFKPVCESVELNNCTEQELINAYDNTILYTDYFLNKTMKMLEKLTHTPTLLLYISDHGESLGEHGLYLHGTPFSIAPDVQKDVPFLLWMSEGFMDLKGYDMAQVKSIDTHSHYNIFHSVMGAFDMHGEAYKKTLDVMVPRSP